MGDFDVLREISRFDGLDDAARADLARTVALALGEDFAASVDLSGERRLLSVLHRPTDLVFVVVPGGEFDMGVSDEDIEEAARYVDLTKAAGSSLEQLSKIARPVRRVIVAPFVCSSVPLVPASVQLLSGGRFAFSTPSNKEAKAFIDGTRFRLPSEAELEWMARDGGDVHFTYDCARRVAQNEPWPTQGAFGIKELLVGEWAADEGHASYDGAPSDSRAWNLGGLPGVYRGSLPWGPDQNDEDIICGLAAWRGLALAGQMPDATVRLAMDLPI